MIGSVYKPHEEILYTLRNINKVNIVACSGCSNWSLQAGPKGLAYMTGVLKKAGKTIHYSRVIISCCLETAANIEIAKHFKHKMDGVEALVTICCTAGTKGINNARPGVPVIPTCDTFGSGPILRRGDKKLHTKPTRDDDRDLCLRSPKMFCADGHCVLSYTAGICPVTECPKEKKYGPCKEAPKGKNKRQCIVYPTQGCAWRIIEYEVTKRGLHLDTLKEAQKLHQDKNYKRLPNTIVPHKPESIAFTSRTVLKVFKPFTYPSYHWLD